MGQTPDSADVVSPSELASIEAEIRNEFGVSEGVVVKMEGKAIKLEVTKELTERMGLGQYKLRLKIREADARFADGYRDVTLLTDLCQLRVLFPKDGLAWGCSQSVQCLCPVLSMSQSCTGDPLLQWRPHFRRPTHV